MAEQKLTDKLEEIKHLLREGRVQEADNQIEELRVKTIAEEAEAAKKKPPPKPQTRDELLLAILDEITALLGIPPNLQALMVELHGKYESGDE